MKKIVTFVIILLIVISSCSTSTAYKSVNIIDEINRDVVEAFGDSAYIVK